MCTTVLAFAYCTHKVYESTVKYFSYPVTTSIRRQYVDNLTFPAVTFCNLNDMRLSMLNNTLLDRAILDNNLLVNLTHKDFQLPHKSAHKLEEMLIECSFDGHTCSHKNFTAFSMIDDKCFTFNPGKEGHELLKVTGSGYRRSLLLTLNIQHYDYYRDRTNGGIHLILHGHEETPIRSHGLYLPPGFSSYIQIDKKVIWRLEPPYPPHCGSLNLLHHGKYSVDACWLEQLTQYVYSNCTCKASFMPGNATNCNGPQAEACMWPKWEEFAQSKMADCPIPCKQDVFQYKSTSRTLFPSERYAHQLKESMAHQPHMKKVLRNVKNNDVTAFMKDNLLRVVIFYDDLSYEFQVDKPGYDLPLFLGDIGGQVGLFVGASALSYFEVVDCLGMIIYSMMFESE